MDPHKYAKMALEIALELPNDQEWLRKILYMCIKRNKNIEKALDYAQYAQHHISRLKGSFEQESS